jgi:hypothetical protein
MSLRVPHVSNNPSKVQLARIAHVYFEHPNLPRFERFAKDFGFVEAKRDGDTVYYRGYGRDPFVYTASKSTGGKAAFGGAAFVAVSQDEFDKASRLPGASPKKSLTATGAPGGGQIITFARPNGTFFHVVFGQEERAIDVNRPPPSETHEYQGPFNTPFEKKRLGHFQRYHDGPALVHKLGHYGYVCKEFDTEFEFYTSNFNITPSDILHHPQNPDIDVLVFMHLDLGKDYSDHHTLFLQRAPPEVAMTYLHHSSYEVADVDTQFMGHQHLAKQGWKSIWGIGRHILGSQIFDYWQDSTGFKVEHYADGDVVNEDVVVGREVAGPISIWGPELPQDFTVDTIQLEGL